MSRDGGNGYRAYVFEESTRRCAIDRKGRGRKEVIYLRVADISCTRGVMYLTTYPPILVIRPPQKLTKNRKNCTLISQQRLNNKF